MALLETFSAAGYS